MKFWVRRPRCALIPTMMSLWMALLFFLSWSPDADAAYRLHFRHGGVTEVPSYQDNGDSISYSRFGGTVTVPKAGLLRIEDITPATPPVVDTPPTTEPSRPAEQPIRPTPPRSGWWFTFAGKFHEDRGVLPATGGRDIKVWTGPLEVGPFETRRDCQAFLQKARIDSRWQGKTGWCYHAQEPIYRVYTPAE